MATADELKAAEAAKALAAKSVAVTAPVELPKFRTIGTGTVTIGGFIFTKEFMAVEDPALAKRLRKLKKMFVEFGTEEEAE